MYNMVSNPNKNFIIPRKNDSPLSKKKLHFWYLYIKYNIYVLYVYVKFWYKKLYKIKLKFKKFINY